MEPLSNAVLTATQAAAVAARVQEDRKYYQIIYLVGSQIQNIIVDNEQQHNSRSKCLHMKLNNGAC